MVEESRSARPSGAIYIDILGILRSRWRPMLGVAVVTAGAVLFVMGVMFIRQPVRIVLSQEFRPGFAEAANGQYPNGLVFSPTDVIAGPILDQVFDLNNLSELCPRDPFKSAFYVEHWSMASAILDLEYQGRLSDIRLTAVQRDQLQLEYAARRRSLPVQFRIVFAKPPACEALPVDVATKALNDTLLVWARDSETRRGVLNVNVEVLTPSVLAVADAEGTSRLIRADLIRNALRRLVANANRIGQIPGASLVKLPVSNVALSEVRSGLLDLIQARLEPLIVSAGQAFGEDSLTWVRESLASAEQEERAARGRAQAYLKALREYSGTGQTPAGDSAQRGSGTGSSDVQSLTPQIDRTFVDKIVEMSAANTAFRQNLTESIVGAEVAAVESQAKVEYYLHLTASLSGGRSGRLTSDEVDSRLTGIVSDGRKLAEDLGALYREISSVTLRPAAGLYIVEKPGQLDRFRDLSFRQVIMGAAAGFAVAFLLAFAFFLFRQTKPEPSSVSA